MKRRFTYLLTALALLLFVAPPMTGWGQTREVQELTNANIVAAGTGATGYQSWTITDDANHTWNAYAIKNQHSNATSDYHFLQIKKYSSNVAYYIQVPELGTQITSITMTVSSTTKPMDGGDNTATLYFSSSNQTSAAGTGVASGTGASSVTIDCSNLSLNTGYITASAGVRIWDVAVTYTTGPITPSISASNVDLEYDATSGNIAYTINNEPDPAGTMTAAINGTPTIVNFTLGTIANNAVPFTCAANNESTARTATVTLTYTYGDDETVTKEMTVTQAAAPPMALYTYSINGVEGQTLEALVGSTITLVAGQNLNNDFTFAGWTTDPNDVSQRLSEFTFPEEDTYTFYAVYEHTTGIASRDEASYVKVTSTDEITDGNYLIVYEDGGVAFDGGLDVFDGVSNTIGVTITNGIIESTEQTNAATFAIASMEGGYSVKGTSGKYIGVGSYSNGLTTNDNPVANSISFEDGNVLFGITFNSGTMTLKYNKSSNQTRFRYYKNGQEDIQLYKYSGGSAPTSFTAYYTRVFLGDHLSFGHLQYDATSDIEIVGPSIVPSNHVLSMGFYALSNDVAANLIIEDGGQVSSMNEDGGKVFAGTMLKNITACDYNPSNNAGYYLIATPIEGFVPTANNGFITTNYDLYTYNATKENEWVNFKSEEGFTTLLGYHGYLYASGQNTTLRFEGLLNDPDMNEGNGGYVEELAYQGGDDAMKDLTLVGNSGTAETTFSMYDDNSDQVMSFNYLTLNNAGDGFISDQDEIVDVAALDAVFVQAPGAYHYMLEGWGEIGSSSSVRNVNVKVSRENGDLLDNAIVSFGGSMMKKLYLTDNSTRVYFPISNQDYAVVRVQSEGDQPVNFKAKENGTYTLSIETKNVEMDYLHLIDNMTGADVDLLANPSYTFEAKTSDYASRFRLVFSANNTDENGASTSSATFAYFNGSSWTISNMGEATLQVVDVMGRVLSSETLSGNAEVNINQPTGVYMLRLVSGDSVKVQKVVVR